MDQRQLKISWRSPRTDRINQNKADTQIENVRVQVDKYNENGEGNIWRNKLKIFQSGGSRWAQHRVQRRDTFLKVHT